MRITFLATALTLLLVGCQAPSESQNDIQEPVRVLFIGNSYTYYNNLPELLEKLASVQPNGPLIEASMVAEGGNTLTDRAEDGNVLQKIGEEQWDVVVLQEQSTFGNVYLVDGQFRVSDPSDFFRSVSTLVREARSSGVRPVLFQHWRTRDAPRQDHQAIAYAYMHIGRKLGVDVAPVGFAWEDVRSTATFRDSLYARDGSHPAAAGSYLAAAVLYEVITGRNLVVMPSEVHGAPVDLSREKVVADTTVALVSLANTDAQVIKKASHGAVERLRSAGGYLDMSDPGLPEGPRLPNGSAKDLASVAGVWAGPLTVYPAPARLQVQISHEKPTPVLEAEVHFDDGPDDISIHVTDVSVTSEGLSFVDPDGPNGGQVRYRGVWLDDKISGIAEIVVPGEDIYGIGSWTLSREASSDQ